VIYRRAQQRNAGTNLGEFPYLKKT
jgi:hypothetical protein